VSASAHHELFVTATTLDASEARGRPFRRARRKSEPDLRYTRDACATQFFLSRVRRHSSPQRRAQLSHDARFRQGKIECSLALSAPGAATRFENLGYFLVKCMLLLWRELHHAPSFVRNPKGCRKSFRPRGNRDDSCATARPRHRKISSAILRNSSVVIFHTRRVCLTFELKPRPLAASAGVNLLGGGVPWLAAMSSHLVTKLHHAALIGFDLRRWRAMSLSSFSKNGIPSPIKIGRIE